MSELVRRLRDERNELATEAADEIERLSSRETVLAGALWPFAEYAINYAAWRDLQRLDLVATDEPSGVRIKAFTVGDIRRARGALASLPAQASALMEEWGRMQKVIEAAERLVGCEIVSISWANAYDALKDALRSLNKTE